MRNKRPARLFLDHIAWSSASAEGAAPCALNHRTLSPPSASRGLPREGRGHSENHQLFFKISVQLWPYVVSVHDPTKVLQGRVVQSYRVPGRRWTRLYWISLMTRTPALIHDQNTCPVWNSNKRLSQHSPVSLSLYDSGSITFVTCLHTMCAIYGGRMFICPSHPRPACTVTCMRTGIFIFFCSLQTL